MTQPTAPRPPLDVHGAIDLSGLGRPPATPQQPGGPAVVDVTEATFADVVQRSSEVPVLVSLWSAADPVSSGVTRMLAELAGELGGRILLARVDVDRAPQVAQAVGGQTGSTVAAVVRGQAVPLPPLDQAGREQVRALLDQVLAMAAANGVTGRVDGAPADPPGGPEPEPAEPPLPPLHQEAYDAIQRDDLDAAAAAYTAALAENPRDDMARAGLAQVDLLRRTSGADPDAARTAADADPTDVDAQLLVADFELLADHVDEAFARLVAVVRRTQGPDRERVRLRLLELFTVVGETDSSVMTARRALANALY
jgi:putative thioredoxin